MSKKIFPIIAALFLTLGSNAQELTDKVVLKKGQIIKMTLEMVSDQKMGERGDMKTDMESVSELVVTEVTEDGYKLEATMKQAKMKFDSPFFKGDYDSEDKEKQDGQLAGGFKKVLNNTETIELGLNGTVVRDEEKQGGMMRMMGGGDAKSSVEGAFMTFPEDVTVGKKWRTQVERDGLKTITEYTYQGMVGNLVKLTANQQVKGEVIGGRAQSIKSKINNLTQMTLMVDPTSGLITMKTMETRDSSETEREGETTKTSGTTKTTITCE